MQVYFPGPIESSIVTSNPLRLSNPPYPPPLTTPHRVLHEIPTDIIYSLAQRNFPGKWLGAETIARTSVGLGLVNCRFRIVGSEDT